jgi:putative MATE family efflux protein
MKNAMLRTSPTQALIRFSWPILVGNLLQQLYSIIDSVIVGNFVGAEALGSIGVTFPVVFMVTCVSFGLSNGASILIGQTVGAQADQRVKTLAYSSLLFSVVIAILISIFIIPNTQALVELIDTPIILQAESTRYLSIYFFGLVFFFGFNMISAIFRSLGDSKTPLIFLGLASIVNIVLDLVFVLVFNMGVTGVAIATVLAQGLAFTLQLWVLKNKLSMISTTQHAWIDFKAIRQLARLSIPTTSQEILISIGLIVTQVLANRFGADVVTAYAASSRIVEFVMLPIINLGIGMTVFTAQNVGAYQLDRVKKAYHSMLKMTLGFGFMMGIIVVLFPRELMMFFLGENLTPDIFRAGESYLYISAVTFILMGLLFPAESLLKGAGDVNMFFLIAVTGSVAKIVSSLALIPVYGYIGIWLGIAVGWGIETVLTLMRYHSGRWKEKRINDIS